MNENWEMISIPHSSVRNISINRAVIMASKLLILYLLLASLVENDPEIVHLGRGQIRLDVYSCFSLALNDHGSTDRRT